MGQGMIFKCKNCENEYGIYLGIGMGYPFEYRETVEDVLAGKYGEEWQQLMKSQKYMAINAEKELYQCNCGNWIVDKNLSIYEPNNEALIEAVNLGEKNEKELDYNPCVMRYGRELYYHFVKSYIHKCDKCGRRMHKADENKINELQCPECHTINRSAGIVNWD